MKKILVIAGGLQLGGAERVAANLSKYAPDGEFEFHYLVFEGLGNVFGSEIEAKGGKVYTIPPPSAGYIAYIKRLSALIKENRYDAVHSHTMFNSGINLLVAKFCGVPCRIAHSHTTKTETKVSIAQKAYENVMRFFIRRAATDFLACGVNAGEWMYGIHLFQKQGVVINNGIDTDAFRFNSENRDMIRARYGIAEDAFVIGHSGTLSVLKNQELLISIMPEILKRKPNAVLMLVGRGDDDITLRLKTLASELGIADKVVFTGGVMDVNAHLSAMDVFAFPSRREGTPLALLEAQANGLPCVVSSAVPEDACITSLVHLKDINDAKAWVNDLCTLMRNDSRKYADVVCNAGYGVKTSYKPIFEIYSNARK